MTDADYTLGDVVTSAASAPSTVDADFSLPACPCPGHDEEDAE